MDSTRNEGGGLESDYDTGSSGQDLLRLVKESHLTLALDLELELESVVVSIGGGSRDSRNSPGWLEVQDDNGETALMHAIR